MGCYQTGIRAGLSRVRGLPAWGRDGVPQEGESVTGLGPWGRPLLHPWAPNRFPKWWARSRGKCPLLQVRASSAPPPPGPLNDASQDPPFAEGGRHPRPLRPPRPAPSQCRPSPVPPPSGSRGHPLRLRRGAVDTKTRGKGRRDPRGGGGGHP